QARRGRDTAICAGAKARPADPCPGDSPWDVSIPSRTRDEPGVARGLRARESYLPPMPRRPRNPLPPTGVYHVTARGVDRCLIVRDEYDWRALHELLVNAQ